MKYTTILSSLILSLVGLANGAVDEIRTRPNVILIVTDDQGYGDMSCHGNPWLRTPNLDRLASQSVQLEDYHVDPVCTPTRAALMTGRYCTRVGAWTVTEGRQMLRDTEVTMADVFAHSGYRTGIFGKWHLGDTRPYAPRFRGFQDVVCHLAGGVDEIGNPIGNDFFDDIYFRDGIPEQFDGYCTDVFFRELMRFVDTKSNRPFFAYLPSNAMHGPHHVAEQYSKRFMELGHPEYRAKFYGMIENLDENLGRLLSQLQDLQIENDTIIIFMGDNGTAQGIGGPPGPLPGFNAGMRGKKGSVYEGGHRVACFARWPERFQAGRQVHHLTCHRDWLPTLIELCHLNPPRQIELDGVSLATLLSSDNENPPWQDRTLFVQRQNDQPMLPKAETSGGKYPHYAVLTERWRMVDGELYDHELDPAQEKNLAREQPLVVAELYELFADHYGDVFADGLPPVPFRVGGEENPVRLTVRDWHPDDEMINGYGIIWQQGQLSDDSLEINGSWDIDVTQAGRYTIRLSRFPADAPGPVGVTSIRLKVGKQLVEKNTDRTDRSATFELQLPAGQTQLQTWCIDTEHGLGRGTYFIEIDRVN
ncbi:MAG: arylsulfatase [Planctomycetaceae bacterium]|nr:arylsulfatase [Planctomycetaceae bacterium]MCB9951813.1 arylsulfatase [Planctomycetaceae bacterium]